MTVLMASSSIDDQLTPRSKGQVVGYSILRVLLALVILVQAEAIIESYAHFWSSNYESIPIEQISEDNDLINALLLTVAALVASLVCFPLVGWLAVVRQSKFMAVYFALLSIVWSVYVGSHLPQMPMLNMAFVGVQAGLSMAYAYLVCQRMTSKLDDNDHCCESRKER